MQCLACGVEPLSAPAKPKPESDSEEEEDEEENDEVRGPGEKPRGAL